MEEKTPLRRGCVDEEGLVGSKATGKAIFISQGVEDNR